MRQASKRIPESAEKTVRDIRRATRRHHSAEEKILRVEVAELRGQMCAFRGSEAVLLAKLFGDAVEPALREYIDKRMSNGRQRHD